MPPDWITIISGLPRSGTSLMMRMIEAAGVPALTDHIRRADEDNPNGYYEFEPVKRTKQDPSWLGQAPGRVVKMVHLLLPDLPTGYSYRIILMLRDMDEVLASQRKMLERSGRKSGDAAMLRRVFSAQLESVKLFMSSRADIRWIDAAYNGLVADPTREAARIAGFLECPEAADRMAAAVDPALYRNRTSGA